MKGAPQPAMDALAQAFRRFGEGGARLNFDFHECAPAG